MERQTVLIDSENQPSGGTFTLTMYGRTSRPLPYNATEEQVERAADELTLLHRLDCLEAIARRAYRRSFVAAIVALVGLVFIVAMFILRLKGEW